MVVVVLDDLMTQTGGDKRISDISTKGSHHRNLSVIYMAQNIFHQGRGTSSITLNANNIVLFKSPRDKQHISALARQVNVPWTCLRIYEKLWRSNKVSTGYLVLDLKSTTNNKHRLKSNVLSEENIAVKNIWTTILESDRLNNNPSPITNID